MKDFLIGQLNRGNNGNQILAILDVLVAEIEETNIQDCDSIQEIAF